MNHFVITNATVFDGTRGGVHPDSTVEIKDGKIIAVGAVTADPAEVTTIDAAGAPVVPGYIDIHCHGAAGAAFDDGTEAASTVVNAHAGCGTARIVASLVTAGKEALLDRIGKLKAAMENDARIVGIHPEGPCLHPAHKGAHPESLLIDPDAELIAAIIETGAGAIRQFTLAPERDGGIAAIKALADAGVTPAVGHTSATYEDTLAAFEAGARILTHTFNGMDGIHHRAPGPVIAGLRTPNVWLEVINDGIHVHPAVVRSLFVEAPERVVLITDAMAATTAEDGNYRLGELAVTVTDGIARTESGSLAGSTLTMGRAVANAVTSVGIDLDLAVAAATSHPAAAIGLEDSFGRLAVGYPADVLILDPQTYLPRRIFNAGAEIQSAF